MSHVLKLWLACLKHYLKMCVFQSSPSNLPFNPNTIVLTLLAYVLVGYALLGNDRSLLSIFGQIMIEVGILYAISSIVLKLVKKPERLIQTMSALIGVNLIVSLVSIPAFYLLSSSTPTPDQQMDSMSFQINVLLLIWNLAIISLIFKRSFQINTLLAGFIAFNYFLLYEYILMKVF
jgi:uncharacterized membrane protein